MGFPKQIKKTLPLVPKKILSERREQLLEYINKDGTYLPKSVLHADLDRGMLDFVKTDLEVITAGKIVPMLDILITTQNWSQYLETWKFVDLDYNPSPPFITVVFDITKTSYYQVLVVQLLNFLKICWLEP